MISISDIPPLSEIEAKVEENILLTELESFVFHFQPREEIPCYKWTCGLGDLLKAVSQEESVDNARPQPK